VLLNTTSDHVARRIGTDIQLAYAYSFFAYSSAALFLDTTLHLGPVAAAGYPDCAEHEILTPYPRGL
jgi:hypothetical protein